jgi:phage gp29-like protein
MAEQTNTKKDPRIFTQAAVAGYDILYKYGISDKENPDKLISSKGMEYLEKKVERDTHFTSVMATRRQKLMKKGWRVDPGSKSARDIQIADFVNHQLEAMEGSFENDLEAMLDKISKGFSLTEINYARLVRGRYQGKVGLQSLRFKPAKYFTFKFDTYGRWIIKQWDPEEKVMPKDKFVHIINGPNDENPYGDSYGAKSAFWVWLKENEAKFWAIFSERFGMPLTRVEMPAKATPEEIAKVDEILEAVRKDTGIRVPKGFVVDFLEAERSGEVGYDNFIERCNKEISKIIIGQTLSSEEGKRGQGSYALGQTHAQTMEDYVAFDAFDLSHAVNEQIIKRLVDYNFLTEVYPKFKFLGIDIGALISLSQTMANLVNAGMKIPVQWAHESTGIPMATDDQEILKPMEVQSGKLAPGKPDNRSNMQEFQEDFIPDPDEYEELYEQYQAQGVKTWTGFLNWFKKDSKKKL